MAIGRALFGNTAGQSQSKNLVEFRAGKMELKGTMVHPDKRKGLVYVHQTDDSLMHFCWKDRTTGNTVDDLIIFPDDVEYKRCNQCTTGRVYVLKFKSTNRKLFFWMQEPKTDKDDEYCKKVNEYLNNPPALGSSRSGGSTPGSGLPSELSNLGDSDIHALLNNMSQQQLMQLFGNVGGINNLSNLTSLLGGRSSSSSSQSSRPATSISIRQDNSATSQSASTPTPTTPASTGTTPTPATTTPGAAAAASGIQLSDLQSILSGIGVPTPVEEAPNRAPIDLSTAVNAEALQPVLENPDFIRRLQELMPPNDTHPAGVSEGLRDTLQSPQFQQALSNFCAGLQSGQLGPLMQQFELDEATIRATAEGDMETFIRAFQASIDKKAKSDGKGPNDKKDDDEDMALD